MEPNLGIETYSKVQFRYSHPRKLKEERCINMNYKNNIKRLLVIHIDIKKISRIKRRCVI